MNFYKTRKHFISLVCAISLLLSMMSVAVAAAGTNRVTATTDATVKQGNYAYCYVDIDSTEGLAALDVTVHYDPAKVKIISAYNSVSCTLYDSVTNADNIQFSYILDGKGVAQRTSLFYFQYQVLSDAEAGDAYFDVTIGEAYDTSLNEVPISGSRCRFTIAEQDTSQRCSIYSSGFVSTAIEREFTLSYSFSTYQIACGTAVISYNAELFEVVEVTNGAFLTNKVVDVNTTFFGEIYVSFVGTEYYSNTNLVSVTFRTLKNVTETSQIIVEATELIDKELNDYSCSGYTTIVQVTHDESYIGDAPKMSVLTEADEAAGKLYATIVLEENAHLGAGDFSLTFDPSVVTLSSYEQKIVADFFLVNDKELADGVFKFSIISLTDIDAACQVIRLTFDVAHLCELQTFVLDLSGSMMVDSLTNTIALNLIDGNVTLSDGWVKGHVYDHPCDVDCNVCGAMRDVAKDYIAFIGNSVSEDVSGLAFRFDVTVEGMAMNRTTAIYDNATVDGYRLLSMGAVVTNGVATADVPVVYLWDLKENVATFAVRVIEIPTDKYDVAITATPYIVLEIDGVATTIYGEAQTCSYNDVKN